MAWLNIYLDRRSYATRVLRLWRCPGVAVKLKFVYGGKRTTGDLQVRGGSPANPHLLASLLPHSLFVPGLQDEMRYRKYDVWITDGADVPLPEYKVEFCRKARTATCYIPSESGKVSLAAQASDVMRNGTAERNPPTAQTFAVHCRDLNNVTPHYFSLIVKLDGREAGASKCTPKSEVKRIGIRTSSRDTYAAYQFADLETTGQFAGAAVPLFNGPRRATADQSLLQHRSLNRQRSK